MRRNQIRKLSENRQIIINHAELVIKKMISSAEYDWWGLSLDQWMLLLLLNWISFHKIVSKIEYLADECVLSVKRLCRDLEFNYPACQTLSDIILPVIKYKGIMAVAVGNISECHHRCVGVRGAGDNVTRWYYLVTGAPLMDNVKQCEILPNTALLWNVNWFHVSSPMNGCQHINKESHNYLWSKQISWFHNCSFSLLKLSLNWSRINHRESPENL